MDQNIRDMLAAIMLICTVNSAATITLLLLILKALETLV